jgi:hypothetical protein
MSATYRQSAIISKEKLKTDPENVFYSYAPRIRMQAELVKDMVLESSGLLNKTIGGPSIKPYQPAGLWEMATSGRGQLATYKQDTGQLLYRRGMYTFIKRTVPPPNMIIFDASNRDQCEVKRSHTNTPLQALVMMNDPIVLEASLALSDHLLTKYNNAAEAAISNGFRRIVCRKPDDKEIKILFNYWKERHDSLAANADAANKVIKVGEYKPAFKSNVDLAAMMQVMQVIYNMEEAITKT